MVDKKKISLSRRKMLGGLGAIGLTGAGAGLGTSALFSDEETFENNSITAGTLDMVVDAEIVATVDNDYFDSLSLEGTSQTADGAAVDMAINIDDAKPGDWLIICFDITIEENPGYVQISTSNFVDNENGVNDPEEGAMGENGMEGGSDTDGELDDKLLATAWDSATVQQSDISSRDELQGLQYPTNAEGDDKPSHSYDSSRSEGGEVSTDIEYTSVAEAFSNFQNGVVVSNSAGDPVGVGPSGTVFYLLLEIPTSVGNEIQSDSVGLDLTFETEQVRNNDDPFGTAYPNDPWLADAQTDKGGVFWNTRGDDSEFALSPGDTFSDLPSPGQPIYVNLTDDPIDVTVTGAGPTVTLNVGAYDGSDLGANNQWVRIPVGVGTPNPQTGAPNYEFVGITETNNGCEVEWQLV
jgi:predicted ribosomally synthesized peptide with SipW-like signal peptide